MKVLALSLTAFGLGRPACFPYRPFSGMAWMLKSRIRPELLCGVQQSFSVVGKKIKNVLASAGIRRRELSSVPIFSKGDGSGGTN